MASHIGPQHLARVRFLYKSILRLHSGLPPELRALGDLYVKEEFRKHKTAEANFIGPFMNEWTDYAITLAQQVEQKKQDKKFGVKMSEKQVDLLDGDQVHQLYGLYEETQKPVDPDNLLGEDPMIHKQTVSKDS